ncbi:DPOLQ-like protein [Mya arenaria]|uniref:DNA-directed DNA polymerase n=1 Tax=Mya arenaria TaxID=6604 RepID=A0ABY7ED61_MYAAR|nr:DPOLQ-like protein [Mya arenaria]
MNASRNVGRKRLGRLPIQCSKLIPIKEKTRNVGGSSKVGCDVDLSFSSSFVSDLENDPGLASALDKLEKAYSTSDQSSAREPSNGNAGRKDITVKPVCANIDTNLHVDIEEDGSNQTKADGKENLDSGAPVKIQPSLGCDELSLGSWGLPAAVVQQYEGRGVSHMFPWQAECLLTGNVLSGGNLVYSAPTSAGKTMVAELLMLKRVLETRKKAIFILPFVSVTREKMFYLQELYQDAGIRVGGFMGHHSPAGGFSNVDVAVCTIEKGNSLINRLLEENKLHQLGILVVDELHLIGDAHRGYLLELLLTKVTYMAEDLNVQLVGMSATLPNLDLLAGWLRADLYRTDFRPVPLTECVKIGTNLYDSSMKLLRQVDVKYAVKGDDDHIVPLCIETVREGHSILIFCPTKVWCEKLAETVAREIYMLLRDPTRASLRDTLEQLRRTPVGLDQVLGKSVQYGVAYHHAGLTFDERDIVEGAFRQGIIKVLVATSTLSSGVNLPARRVLVRTPVFHGHIIDFLTYKQMIGRAGRKGVDTAGESILLVKPSERSKAEQLVGGALPPVHSTLIRDKGESLSSSLKRAILEVVVSGVASCPRDVEVYASCTLLAASLHGETDPCNAIQECIDFLLQNEFITVQNVTDIHGLAVFSELQKARQCFVLENELHIIYQVTPIYAQIDGIDWLQYFSMWEGLSPGMRRVAELVGVKESFLVKAIRGRIPTSTPAQLRTLAVHRRFYTCLALHDLVHEVPINDVCKKYNCNKGQLQSLQQSGATFAGMVTVFCARLGWSNLELILSQFQSRLTFGVQRELCDLVRISALNGQRARVLYNGGFQTVAALAGASAPDIEALLKKTAPFQSMKKQESETAWEAEERRKAHCIFLTGRRGVTELEAATIIIDEAKQIIQDELGGVGVQWGPKGKPPTPKVKTPVLLSPLASGSKKRRFGQQGKALYEKKQSPINRDTSLGKADISVLAPPVLQLASTARIGTTGGEGNGNKLSEEQQGEAAARPERAGGEDVIQDCVEDISFSTALDDLESNDEFFQNIDINDKLPVSERSCDKISCGNSSSQEIQELEKGTVVSNPSGLENNRNDINMDTEFTESFAVDTQVMDVVNRVENICKADKHVVDNGCKQKTERPYSEALFSDLMPDDSFDMMANELSQMPGKEINSVPVSNNVQTSEGSENNSILYSSSSFNNGLDMNISHGSTEDMFNNSVGLIAASNYERVALADDSRLSSAALSRSFEDLHIPYQSGQEKCFEGGDKGNIVVRANMCTELGKSKGDMIKKPPGQHGANIEQRNTGSNMGILGQFSSQKDTSIKHSLSKEKIHEDLAVVLAMGESFSSTFNMTAANHNNEQINNQANSEDVFGDSMTVSMMESVGSISEQNIPKSTGVISNNKLHSTKENEQKEMKLSKLDTKDGSEFVTPSRRPRKRASLSSCSGKKSSKIQKMKDDNYTTPVKAPSNNESEKIVYNKSIQSKRKKNDSEVSNSETVCSASSSKSPGGDMNTSTGSDYVPPTPPDEAPTGVPGVGRSPANTPRKLQGATFSPRLKRSLIATTSKLSGTTIGNFSLKKRELLKNVSQSRSSNKGSSKIMSDRNGNNKVVRKLTETQTRNKRSQSEGLNRTNDAKFIFGPGKTPVTELQTEGGIYNDKDVNNIEDDHIEVLNEVDENDDKLSPSFIDPDMSGVPLTQQSFSIIDVCGDKRLFKMFIMEWRTKSRYAVSLACEKLHTENTGTAIGANFRKDVGSTYTDQGGIPLEQEGLCIVGIAVSWDNRDAYYVSFTQQQPQGDPDDSLAPPPIDKDISFAIRVKAVKSVLQQATCQSEPVTILMFDVKTQYRALVEGCGFHPKGRFEDPKIACWILDPGAKEKNLHRMVTNFLPSEVHMIHGIGGGIGVGSLGMSPANPGSGRYRATTEAVLVRHLAMYFQACLEKEGTLDTYTQVEMSAAVTLCRMELNGFGFSQEESERQKSVMLSKLSALEQQVYQMAGHPFSLSATEDVAQYSTSKDILEKLRKLHPLPGLILEWRRITNALTKTVFPLQREKVRCDWLDMERIYGDCQLHTATGRVSMTEPNLQNVPKDFDIMLPDIIGESPPPHMSASERRMTRARRRQGQGEGQVSVVTGDGAGGTFSVSMRHAFVPFKDGMLLAADYSQLELRMIAHLSCDQKLIRVLNEDGDVFKLITAQWKNISPDEVTADQRAQAKQVCYGMIYGIGAKALGEQLEVEENDAAVFIETFKARYPVMRAYLRQTVDQCRMDGFVKTILGRKRYLPGITSTQPHARAQAERQAVNTTVQGSAADLVKTAMVRIDDRLAKMQKCPPAGGYLVLQLHDELIYEVSSEHMADLARVVKQCMENTMELSVRMPVKIKVGASWGKLQDYTA